MNDGINYFLLKIPASRRSILLCIGILFCMAALHAQYPELNKFSTDPTHFAADLPTFFAKDSAKGSPYLVKTWLRGVLDLANHRRLPESGHVLFFNYDKMNQRLYVTDGINKTWSYPADSIRDFYLADSGFAYYFERVPGTGRSPLSQVLVRNEKGYSLYKRIVTRFIRANFRNEGYYTTGRDFDQYKDVYEYYIVRPGQRNGKIPDLGERTLRKIFKTESAQLALFLPLHARRISEEQFVEFIHFLNGQNDPGTSSELTYTPPRRSPVP